MDITAPMRLTDYLSLPCLIPILLIRTSINFLRSLSPSSSLHALHWRQKLPTSLLVAIRTTLNSRISYAANTRQTTGQQIREYCLANKLTHRQATLPTPSSPTLHFVSTAATGPTVLYIHGGGYVYPMVSPCHMPLALHIATSSRAKQVVYLEYGLAPENKYPGQLCQLVDAVNHLLQQGVKPSQLILAGDSAGVHLIIGLLAHITKPCPKAPAPLDLGGEQIRAAVLLSPWLDMQLTSVAPATGTMDVLTSTQLANSAKLFGTNPTHPWCEPLVAEDGVEILRKAFSGSGDTKPVVGKVLVTIGDAEVLFESCQQFFANFEQFETVVMDGKGKDAIKSIAEKEAFVFAVGLGEVHVQPGIDIATGFYNGGTMTALTAFLNTL